MTVAARVLNPTEIEKVLGVQCRCYSPDLLESRECFLNKMRVFPQGCVGAFVGDDLIGYVFFHPWNLGQPVKLDMGEYDLPLDADCLYIHDLAILPEHRKSGCGRSLIDFVVETGRNLGLMNYALVAVQNSEGYWKRWGFEASRPITYGAGDASYMICRGIPEWIS